ncbi:MAG TPA: alpha/beta fold hydrolase [Kofleriaceae bacterium]|nr:alpha/beta fold hydrolase [Kofleriaceae bacterium]
MALVLLHGFAQTPASWREVEAALPPEVEARAIDIPVGATWDDTIDQLAQVIAPEDIACGYSLGARVALGLLARDAVRAAILIGVHPGLASDDERAARLASDAAWAERLREQGTREFLAAWEAQPMFASQAARASADVRARRHAERSALDAHTLARSMEVLGLGAMPDLRATLVEKAARVHLVVGADDTRFLALARTLVHEAPALVCNVVANSGHDPTLEQPAALAATIARALARW